MFRLSAVPVALVALSVVLPGSAQRSNQIQRDVTYQETVVASFGAPAGAAGGPASNLIQAVDGNLWGATVATGSAGYGEIFRVTPGGVYTVMHTFTGKDGAYPYSSLVQGQDGNLYGTTSGDDTDNSGTIYKITPAGGFSVLHTFTAHERPFGGLIQDNFADFYGVTSAGGTNGQGEIYKYDNAGNFSVIFNCSAADCGTPYSTLIQGSDGNGYGTAQAGGSSQYGAVYKFTPGSGVTVVHAFDASEGHVTGGLVQTGNGLWGHTSGNAGQAILFVLTPTGSNDGLAFNNAYTLPGTDADQFGTLMLGGDGELYGATSGGGSESDGAVYSLDQASYIDPLIYDFTGTPDGSAPWSDPIETADGNLWGTTTTGGANGNGVIYKITPSTPITPAISLVATPPVITMGETSKVAYSVNNAYSDTAMQCYGFVQGNPYGQFPTSGSVTFTPSGVGVTSFAYSCGGTETATATVTVTGADITFSSVTHNMGSVPVGSKTAGTENYGVQVKNNDTTPISATGITLSGSPEFTQYNNCPATLAGGATCEIIFTFAPTAMGTQTATWSLSGVTAGKTFAPSNGGTLSGTGVSTGNVTLVTAGHNFGTIAEGSTSPVYGTVLMNATPNDLTLTLGSVSAPFNTTLNNCGAILKAGVSCNLQFDFAPAGKGITQQTFGVAASLNGAPITITSGGTTVTGIKLTGTGQ